MANVDLKSLTIQGLDDTYVIPQNLNDMAGTLDVDKGGTGVNSIEELKEVLDIEDVVSVSKGGTGATTAQQARANLGIMDYIVERGTSGIWDYEKWASGAAICYGSRPINNLSVATPYGSLFRTQITSVSLPDNLFVSAPYVFPVASSTYKVWITQSGNESAENTGNSEIYSAISQTVGVNVRYKVVGKWK